MSLTLTYNGHEVRYDNPSAQMVDTDDLYRSLRREYRWLGHVNWTVLEHLYACAMVAENTGLSDELVAHVAMHDLAEAYVRDLPTGLKRALGKAYSDMEYEFLRAIYRHFDMDMPSASDLVAIKGVDLLVLEAEAWRFGHHHDVVSAQVGGEFDAYAREVVRSCTQRRAGVDRAMYDETLWYDLLVYIERGGGVWYEPRAWGV